MRAGRGRLALSFDPHVLKLFLKGVLSDSDQAVRALFIMFSSRKHKLIKDAKTLVFYAYGHFSKKDTTFCQPF